MAFFLVFEFLDIAIRYWFLVALTGLMIVITRPHLPFLAYLVGILSNRVAIAFNHGYMPALGAPYQTTGHTILDMTTARLIWLCDVFAIPDPAGGEPLLSFSIGDVLIVLGAWWIIGRFLAQRLAPSHESA